MAQKKMYVHPVAYRNVNHAENWLMKPPSLSQIAELASMRYN
ncbi:hypothetical protein AB28_5396 [Raoultella ornithinolytica 2-156-04_S1_C2]|nr:hypothetical protein AB28_5396 [Raoultella ornithinolytica 2-156-04_S1_C2]